MEEAFLCCEIERFRSRRDNHKSPRILAGLNTAVYECKLELVNSAHVTEEIILFSFVYHGLWTLQMDLID